MSATTLVVLKGPNVWEIKKGSEQDLIDYWHDNYDVESFTSTFQARGKEVDVYVGKSYTAMFMKGDLEILVGHLDMRGPEAQDMQE